MKESLLSDDRYLRSDGSVSNVLLKDLTDYLKCFRLQFENVLGYRADVIYSGCADYKSQAKLNCRYDQTSMQKKLISMLV